MYLLFDIGGTKTRIALSDGRQIVNDVRVFPTSQSFSEGKQLLVSTLGDLLAGQQIEAISGGFPGVFSSEEIIAKAPNLKDWIGHSLAEEIKTATGFTKIYVKNDADLAGLGEAIHGAGKDYSVIAYLTVSTGVGGTRIVNKKMDISIQGFEPGHQIIDADGSIFPESAEIKDGMTVGYLENYISGKYLQLRTGQDPVNISDPEVWNKIERLLAIGLNNTAVYWSPQIIILGGGVINSGKLDLNRLKSYLSELLRIFPNAPELKFSELRDMAGLYGALEYAKAQEAR